MSLNWEPREPMSHNMSPHRLHHLLPLNSKGHYCERDPSHCVIKSFNSSSFLVIDSEGAVLEGVVRTCRILHFHFDNIADKDIFK